MGHGRLKSSNKFEIRKIYIVSIADLRSSFRVRICRKEGREKHLCGIHSQGALGYVDCQIGISKVIPYTSTSSVSLKRKDKILLS